MVECNSEFFVKKKFINKNCKKKCEFEMKFNRTQQDLRTIVYQFNQYQFGR